MAGLEDRNDRTLFVGNVERNCSEEILFELFLQAGPLEGVKIAKEKDGASKGFAFIEFKHDISVPYALHLFGGTFLYGRQLALKFRKGSKHEQNQYQGPPPQAFPKGFPEQTDVNDPPNAQRLQLPIPYANNYQDMPVTESMWLPPPNGSMDGRQRGSPDPYFYGSPHSPGQRENYYRGSQRRHFEQTYGNEVATSSGSPHWESPPVMRETSPRWAAQHYRGENVEHHEGDSHRSQGTGHDRSANRRHHQRNQQLHRSRSYGGGHSGRDDRYQPREEERHRGRERSRTTEENIRGYGGGRQGGRDRSLEERHRHRHRGNDGQRPQHYR